MSKRFHVSQCVGRKYTAHKTASDYRVFGARDDAQLYADCRNEGMTDAQSCGELVNGAYDPVEEYRMCRP